VDWNFSDRDCLPSSPIKEHAGIRACNAERVLIKVAALLCAANDVDIRASTDKGKFRAAQQLLEDKISEILKCLSLSKDYDRVLNSYVFDNILGEITGKVLHLRTLVRRALRATRQRFLKNP
jgi:hypothetical protein